MSTTCTIIRNGKEIAATSDTLENLKVLLATMKPCTVDPNVKTPAMSAAEYVSVKFAAIIAKDEAEKANKNGNFMNKANDVFFLHSDVETGANAKSGFDVKMTRKEILEYAKKVLAWGKSAPGMPPVTFIKTDGRKRVVKADGEFGENE